MSPSAAGCSAVALAAVPVLLLAATARLRFTRRFTADEGRVLELAFAGDRAAQLAGPYLTLLLPDPPPAQRDMDA